jgi:glucose-1-phosphate cytidylyltransferase
MKVVILCGGQGTRIRDVAEHLPKPMIPVGPYPILWHIMKHYAGFGHDQFVLCLGYKSHVIKDFFLNYEAHTNDLTVTLGAAKKLEFHGDHDESGWRVTLAETGHESLTATRIGRIRRYIGDDDTFLLTYGDGVSDVDVGALVDFHRRHGKVLTVTGVRPPGRFGEMVTDGDGRVCEFNEKPQTSEGRISGGFFVCDRRLFDYLDAGADQMLEVEPMRKLVADGEMVMYPHDGFWQCMDTQRDYGLLNGLWNRGAAPWKTWDKR